MKFNEERTFGVEIEFFNAERCMVYEALVAKGIKVKVENYNHTTRDYWKIVTDSSVNESGCYNENGSGNEIVSPILKGLDGLEQLRLVCEALKECNAQVDKTCGVHIHHGVDDLDFEQIKNVYALNIRYENVIDSMLPSSRKNQRYCRELNTVSAEINEYLKMIKNLKNYQSLQYWYDSRYYKLNHKNYRTRGTLEFRQHSGTIDFEKIGSWVIFTQQLVERSKTSVQYKTNISSFQTLKECLNVTKKDGDLVFAAFKFLESRIKHFAQKRRVA
jgi:hypothetical protein